MLAEGKADPNFSEALKQSHTSNSNESTYSSHKQSGVCSPRTSYVGQTNSRPRNSRKDKENARAQRTRGIFSQGETISSGIGSPYYPPTMKINLMVPSHNHRPLSLFSAQQKMQH